MDKGLDSRLPVKRLGTDVDMTSSGQIEAHFNNIGAILFCLYGSQSLVA